MATPQLLPAGALSTSGSQIVDGSGNPVKIACAGWTGNNYYAQPPNLLWADSYKAIVNAAVQIGFNCIRFSLCDRSVVNNPTIAAGTINFTLNPDLSASSTYLGVHDAIFAYCGTVGMRVIVDSHNSEGISHGYNNANGLWYDLGGGSLGNDEANGNGTGNTGTITDAIFLSMWQAMATRWKNYTAIVGYDLRNEPNVGGSLGTTGSTWGDGSNQDIRAMYQRVGNAILAIDSRPLIICEGLQHYGQTFATGIVDGFNYGNGTTFWGNSGDLTGIRANPVVLNNPKKLVYSVHEYPPETSGNSKDAASQTKIDNMTATWGFVVMENIAPVWVGEMGSYFNGTSAQIAQSTGWMNMMIAYCNGTAVNGPRFSGGNQGIGTDWWNLDYNDAGNVNTVPDFGVFTSATNLTPLANQYNLYSQLLFFGSTTTPPPTVTPSPDGTVITTIGPAITDAAGNLWSLMTSSTSGLAVAVAPPGGAAVQDTTTRNVIKLAYVKGLLWQENSSLLWWSKSFPSDTWLPVNGTATSPLTGGPPIVPSPDGTVVTTIGPAIADANGHMWTLVTSSASGLAVAVDSVQDTTTRNVIKLAFVSNKIWQENASLLWWSKTLPTDAWSPSAGTTVSPIGATTTQTFNDDFTSLSLHSPWTTGDNWQLIAPDTPNGRGGPNFNENGTQWWINPFNPSTPAPGIYTASGGLLTLEIVPTPAAIQTYVNNQAGATMPYIGPLLNSSQTLYQQYGYFEFSVAVDRTNGLGFQWDIENVQLTLHWPPEIDIRIWTDGSNVQQLLVQLANAGGGYTQIYATNSTAGFNGAVQNIYGLNWQSDFVTFYLNGTQKGQIANPGGVYTADKMFMFLVGYATYPSGVNPNVTAALPGKFVLDYVKAWTDKPLTSPSGPPPAASAAGYSVRTFGPAVTLGANWVGYAWDGDDPALAGATQNANGSVTISGGGTNAYSGQISTGAPTGASTWSGQVFAGGAYFEATMSFTGTVSTAGGWPSFWAAPGNASLTNPGGRTIELDLAEFLIAGSTTSYSGFLHDCDGINHVAFSNTPIVVTADFTQPHKYGALWVPATATTPGRFAWYFDGVQVGSAATWTLYNPATSLPTNPYSILDVSNFFLMLGTGPNNPLTVSSVEVWQATGTVITPPATPPGTSWNIINGLTAWGRGQVTALGARVSNNGIAYQAVVAGTTSTIGNGPTGTGNDIIDGSTAWAFIGNIDFFDRSGAAAALPTLFTKALTWQFYNTASQTTTAGVQFLNLAGHAMPAGTGLTLTAAPTDSLRGRLIGQSVPLTSNTAYGSSFLQPLAAGANTAYTVINDPIVSIDGLQFIDPLGSSGSTILQVGPANTTFVGRNLIIDGYAQAGASMINLLSTGTVVLQNCLIIDRQPANGTAATVGVSTPGPASIHLVNCTMVALNNPSGASLFATYAGGTATNCVFVGYGTVGNAGWTFNYCATTTSSFGSGIGIGEHTSEFTGEFTVRTLDTNIYNITAASTFVDPVRDWRTIGTSPLIDAGINASADIPSADDISGMPRNQGPNWDIGCWERQSFSIGQQRPRPIKFW